MQVAILVGGLATRLEALTANVPKCMLEIYGNPFLEYQLDLLRKNGVEDVVLCTGYHEEQIIARYGNGNNYGLNIKYSSDGKSPLGTAGAIKNAEGLLKDEFFIMYGDSYLHLDFCAVLRFFRRYKKSGLMVVYKNYDHYDRSNVVVEDKLIKRYDKQNQDSKMIYIDYGVSLLTKETLRLVPPNQVYSLEEFFPRLIQQKEMLAYEVKERFYQIGNPEGLNEFKLYLSNLKENTKL